MEETYILKKKNTDPNTINLSNQENLQKFSGLNKKILLISIILLIVSVFFSVSLYLELNKISSFSKDFINNNLEEIIKELNKQQISYRISDDAKGVLISKKIAISDSFFERSNELGFTIVTNQTVKDDEMLIINTK